MSKTARRNVRQAVALAAELNLHSVALYGVVWTLHHPKQQQQQELKAEPATSTGCKSASHSRRADKSAARLEDFQTAKRFRIGRFFRRWQQSIRPKPPLQALPPPSITTLPPPPPMPSTVVAQQQPTQQQPPEQMDDERAPKRAPSTPLAADSPATPRAKRTLQLPQGLPPPSLPPSPPSSTSTPPHQGGTKPPEQCSNQIDDGQTSTGCADGPQSSAAGRPSMPETSPSLPAPVPVPRLCSSCERHVTSGWAHESAELTCDECYDDAGSDDENPYYYFQELVRLAPDEWSRWESTEMGFRCKGCAHVLPWLHAPAAALCGRCSRREAGNSPARNARQVSRVRAGVPASR